MPVVYVTNEQRKRAQIAKRMDRFDSIVTEYLRSTGFTTIDLSYELGIDPSTLWRYRHKVEAFQRAPFTIITDILQLAKCTTETLRYVCGMGGSNERY